jgi:hypothetical protein
MPASSSLVSDVNTLDDYQEGLYSPILVMTGGSYAYGGQVGHYTRIGTSVLFSGYIFLADSGSSYGSSNVTLNKGGLPFTISNLSGEYFGFSQIGYVYRFDFRETTSGAISPRGANIPFYRLDKNTTSGFLGIHEVNGQAYALDGSANEGIQLNVSPGPRIQTGGWYISSGA